jgi:hypothetical protein
MAILTNYFSLGEFVFIQFLIMNFVMILFKLRAIEARNKQQEAVNKKT